MHTATKQQIDAIIIISTTVCSGTGWAHENCYYWAVVKIELLSCERIGGRTGVREGVSVGIQVNLGLFR